MRLDFKILFLCALSEEEPDLSLSKTFAASLSQEFQWHIADALGMTAASPILIISAA